MKQVYAKAGGNIYLVLDYLGLVKVYIPDWWWYIHRIGDIIHTGLVIVHIPARMWS